MCGDECLKSIKYVIYWYLDVIKKQPYAFAVSTVGGVVAHVDAASMVIDDRTEPVVLRVCALISVSVWLSLYICVCSCLYNFGLPWDLKGLFLGPPWTLPDVTFQSTQHSMTREAIDDKRSI